MRLDLIYIESLQQRGSLVGPQGHPLPLGSRLAFRAFPRPVGHAPVGLHHVLQTRVHLLGLLGVHAIHHARMLHATLHHTHTLSDTSVPTSNAGRG